MDVVGYSNIYRADPKGIINILKPIVKRLKSELKGYNKATGTNNGMRFHQMYGDTLDISFKTGDNDEIRFLALLDITCMVQKELMKAGLMVRGAILCDDLIDLLFQLQNVKLRFLAGEIQDEAVGHIAVRQSLLLCRGKANLAQIFCGVAH